MDALLQKINMSLVEYYRDREKRFDASAQQVGWKGCEAQERRFQQLMKVVEVNSCFSLNDYGCGHGDLSSFATVRGFSDFFYTGYDLFPSMIDRARQTHGECPNRKFVAIHAPEEMTVADYTVASGVLNLRFDISDDEWIQYIERTIRLFDTRSRKGFAFNALTSYSDKERMCPELYYANPGALFDFCKRNISRNVALLHDYQEYDFTIIVRK